jgi:hypothetical protein
MVDELQIERCYIAYLIPIATASPRPSLGRRLHQQQQQQQQQQHQQQQQQRLLVAGQTFSNRLTTRCLEGHHPASAPQCARADGLTRASLNPSDLY